MPLAKQRRTESTVDKLLLQCSGLGISRDKLAKLLAAIKENKDDAETLFESSADCSEDFRNLIQAAHATSAADTLVSEDIVLSNGTSFKWELLSPTKEMTTVLRSNEPLRNAMGELFRQHGGRLSLVWTADETFSGNPLHESGRKIWVASFSFAECSRQQLSQDSFWFTPAVVRSKLVHLIPGGCSRLFASLLHLQLFNTEDGLATAGLIVVFNHTQHCLFATFHSLITDGDAWKVILEAKGAGGLRPCPICQNCWSLGSDLSHRARGHIEISESNPARFHEHTSMSLWRVINEVFKAQVEREMGRLSAGNLRDTESALGFSPTVRGVWRSQQLVQSLRFPETLFLDWVLSALQHGCFNNEFDILLQHIDDNATSSFMSFSQGWTFPSAEVRAGVDKCRDAFAGGSITGHSRPSATDMLAFAAIVHCWATVTSHKVPESFLAMCQFMYCIQLAKFGGEDVDEVASLLDTFFSEWLEVSLRTHGEENCIPKSHWLGHLGRCLRKFRIMLDTFITERLNRRAKVAASPVRNTKAFERTVVVGLLVGHCSSFPHHDHIVGGGEVGTSCMSLGRRISAGSLVRLNATLAIGSVLGCTEESDGISLLVGVRSVRPGAATRIEWSFISAEPHMVDRWRAADCSLAFGWRPWPPDELVLSSPQLLLLDHNQFRTRSPP